MRISDWSSDVCSSDLPQESVTAQPVGTAPVPHAAPPGQVDVAAPQSPPPAVTPPGAVPAPLAPPAPIAADRKSVVSGKSVSVRSDPGGRRHIKKKRINST